ncbi:MAG TPA: hypothetical protein VMB77_15355 [Syntrophales bacterium]|nr:hypothetical protein [Syntrophales bacterium]
MKLKAILGFDTWIFGAVWILLFVAGRDRLFRDPGTFAHTVIGERILDTGHLIERDPFSFTRFEEPWIAQQWLGECIMAVIHRIAGLDGLLVVTVALIALLYANLAARIERSGMDLVLGSLILALSMAVASHHLHVRPHIVTIVFMAAVYGKLCNVDAKRAGIGSLAWLIPMFVIWANIHGGVLGGLLTLLLSVAGWTLAWKLGWDGPIRDRKHLASLWSLTLLSFAAPFVNPYGLSLPAVWLEIMRSKAVSELIQEHASVITLLQQGDAASFATVTLLLSLGFFYIALLAGTDRKAGRIAWLIPVVWFLLSLTRIRHTPLFAVTAVVAIAEIFPHCAWVRRLGDKGLVTFRVREWIGEPQAGFLARALLPTAVTGMALLTFLGSAQLPLTAQKWVTLDGTHWPIGLLPELHALEKDRPSGSPIFNDMLFGGFLIYQTPGLRVFIDDRCELYGDDFLFRYVRAERSDFDAWLKEYHYELALLLPDSNYRKYLEEKPDWQVVKDCPAAILFQKRSMEYPGNDG